MNAAVDSKVFKANRLKAGLDPKHMPEHIAVIMDGNGRWAKQQGFMSRVRGHEVGVEALRKITTASAELGLNYLTVYAFSTENWNRPKAEVDALMNILMSALEKELPTLMDNNVRLCSIGNLDTLPPKANKKLMSVIQATAKNDGLTLTLALSYGSQDEMVQAIRKIAQKVAEGSIDPADITEASVEQYLFTAGMPHPDLMIRTSGEQRISNYLLWQLAYAELYFTPVLWPDFDASGLYDAIAAVQKRERRFGQTSEQLTS
ncbi:MAG: isoprenyl transferase [Bacteroidetes bacterium]|nr:isoprenyl transferase [Bacteroidota bacterium]